jgi:transposase
VQVRREHKIISAVLSMGIKFSIAESTEWIEMFENGRTGLTDAERSGLPPTATTRNEERTLKLIHENRITVEEVAGKLNVNVGSAYFPDSLQP